MGIKEALAQYCDTQQEIKDIKSRIETLERQIAVMEKQGYTQQDSVTGGEGGNRHYKIEGYPYPEYSRKTTLLICRRQQLNGRELKLLELTNEVEEYIGQIEDSRIRRMITYRFLDEMTWQQVAFAMRRKYTENGCKKMIERFFKEI